MCFLFRLEREALIMRKKKKIYVALFTVVFLCMNVTTGVFADSNTNYNRNNAKWYATNYATNPNTEYANYENDGGDCTNFASQVLKYGGISMTTKKSSPDNTADWYYYGSNWPNRTASWTTAHYFRGYFGNVNGVGYSHAYAMDKYSVSSLTKLIGSSFSDLKNSVWAGDIIQWTTGVDGQTRHSMIVVGFDGSDVLVAYRNASGGTHTASTSLKSFVKSRSSSDWITVLRIKNGS